MDGVVEIVVNRLGELNGDNDVLTLAELDADHVSSVLLDGDNPGDGVTVADAQDDALCVEDSVEDSDADDDMLLGGDCVSRLLADTDGLDDSDTYNEELISADGVTVADAHDDAL